MNNEHVIINCVHCDGDSVHNGWESSTFKYDNVQNNDHSIV